MNIINHALIPIDFDFVELLASLRRFFVYPGPKGSEEPSPDLSGRARRSQNQFTPLGAGVNLLIFKRLGMNGK